jgi:hypothetical protein
MPLGTERSSDAGHAVYAGMLRFLVDRYGPPVSVIVPWPILQPSSKLAAMTKSS